MRLLNTSTYLLEIFADAEEAPPYAILSHTWGDDEILFNDVNIKEGEDQAWTTREAAEKTMRSSKQARDDGHAYIWIDTICIDKSSSAELSEAINSMFNWYRMARICYAYLPDVHDIKDLEHSRWISRGWTLQELIAPNRVEFYGKEWYHIGSRKSLANRLEALTKINWNLLSQISEGPYSFSIEKRLASIGIATKMSWASRRETKRREDIAYCLMGIFGVHMPLLYGEGDKAFQRLQQEILKDTTDSSILAYEWPSISHSSLLASHPLCFRHSLSPLNLGSSPIVRYSSQQVTFEALLCPFKLGWGSPYYGAILYSYFNRDVFSRAVLHLECISKQDNVFRRTRYQQVYRIQESDASPPCGPFLPGM